MALTRQHPILSLVAGGLISTPALGWLQSEGGKFLWVPCNILQVGEDLVFAAVICKTWRLAVAL
jgi:hypothetical protein